MVQDVTLLKVSVVHYSVVSFAEMRLVVMTTSTSSECRKESFLFLSREFQFQTLSDINSTLGSQLVTVVVHLLELVLNQTVVLVSCLVEVALVLLVLVDYVLVFVLRNLITSNKLLIMLKLLLIMFGKVILIMF